VSTTLKYLSKGNAVVIQDLADYVAKVGAILGKDDKFKQLTENETRKRETRLQGYLRKLLNDGLITKGVYNRITPCGSRSGIMYGLPKIHKEGAPIRPIISSIGTYNYKLAKYLDEILKPLTTKNNYIIKDTFDFVNKVSKLETTDEQHVVSFDVESLFTNIPTDETIEIILNRAFPEENSKFHGLNRDSLKKLLVICTKESHFKFHGKHYDQIDGVAMGSPLGPLFANIFMDEFETKHMGKLTELGVQSWLRYVDDVFSTIHNKDCANKILTYINQQHPNIRFTIEMEKNKRIPFLDTVVTRTQQGYRTSLYHKKTFTGVYLNWTSLTSRKYKIGLIKCLCDRIWKICDRVEDRELEIKKLKHILAKNEYPEKVVDAEIDKFIKRKSSPLETPTPTPPLQTPTPTLPTQPSPPAPAVIMPSATNQEAAQTETTTTTPTNEDVLESGINNIQIPNAQKRKKFIPLPYVNHKADEFAYRLSKLVKKTFPLVELVVAFSAPNEIGKLFPFKDNIEDDTLKSLVVYKIKCETCGQEYIGKTERILVHRIKEHNTGKQDSAIKTHRRLFPTHEIDANNIEIIDRASNNFKLELKETLHILSKKPALNTQHAASYKNKEKPFSSKLKFIIVGKQG
jgi:hypothetical protein